MNRALAVKHERAKRERIAFVKIEYSKPDYLAPRLRVCEDMLRDVTITRIPAGQSGNVRLKPSTLKPIGNFKK